MRKTLIVVLCSLAILVLWISADLLRASPHDLRRFDAHAVAKLETAMWRSYYEHRRVAMFAELADLLRTQYHLPYWRSWAGAWHAARAAVVFERGRQRSDYRLALPHLVSYYGIVRRGSVVPFDIQ